jgi:FKBP-type peptidyl-prolyl cis-trans isomerase FklB
MLDESLAGSTYSRSARASLRYRAAAIAILLASVGCDGATPLLEDPDDRASYSLGHQIGTDLARENKEVDSAALLRGLRDGLAGASPSVAPDEMSALLQAVKAEIEALDSEPGKQMAREHRARGDAFLTANAEQDDVIALPSGLQYRVLKPGTGSRPARNDQVSVHYRSSLIDGTVFHDSRQSGDEPETLHVSGVIRGLSEALQLMHVGGRWQLFIPADLAFGRRGPLAHRAVLYDVELISIRLDE